MKTIFHISSPGTSEFCNREVETFIPPWRKVFFAAQLFERNSKEKEKIEKAQHSTQLHVQARLRCFRHSSSCNETTNTIRNNSTKKQCSMASQECYNGQRNWFPCVFIENVTVDESSRKKFSSVSGDKICTYSAKCNLTDGE